MQTVSFPPVGNGVKVTVTTAREPPERSWSRYKKLLIDNPRDSDLMHRQKLWNFQKLNRGAFRTQLASLPDIPYRVHTNTAEKVSVAVQADPSQLFSHTIKVIFSSLPARRCRRRSQEETDTSEENDDVNSGVRHVACSPMPVRKVEYSKFEYSDDFDSDSSIEDPGYEFETVTRKYHAGTMTDAKRQKARIEKRLFKRKHRQRKSAKDRHNRRIKEKLSILKSNNRSSDHIEFPKLRFHSENKTVNFDAEFMTPRTPDTETDVECPTKDIGDQTPPDEELEDELKLPLDKIGHSSHVQVEKLSILDLLSGSKSDRSHTTNRLKPFASLGEADRRSVRDTGADREWFEKIIGDREVIDKGTYENYARTRPNQDNQHDSNNDRNTDTTKNSPRKNFTPRINDEFPTYRQVLSKNSQSRLSVNSLPALKSRSNRHGMLTFR